MSHRVVSKKATGREAIADLREAARTRAWNGCRNALGRALVGLPPEVSLELAEGVLRDGLRFFERYYPGVLLPRRALEGEIDGLFPECRIPGANSILEGVVSLQAARERSREPAACRRHLLNVVGHAIMGNMDTAWGTAFPDRWRQWYGGGFDEEPIRYRCGESPRGGFLQYPDVVRIDLESWNRVADRLTSAWDDAMGHADG